MGNDQRRSMDKSAKAQVNKASPDWQSPVLRRAHRLALMTVPSISSIALTYGTAADLRVLGASEAICRWRKEKDKVRVIRRHIQRLRKDLAQHGGRHVEKNI